MSELSRHSPRCAVCSDRYEAEREANPFTTETNPFVESYEVIDEPCDGLVIRGRLTVIAECSHGKGFKPGTIQKSHARIDVPAWWTQAHMTDAVAALVFFGKEKNPSHGLVVNIG